MSGMVLTANRILDGVVVFHTADGRWSEAIDDALVADDAEAIAALEALAVRLQAGNDVTDVYTFAAVRDGRRVRPLHIRERIRALGPSVRDDLGKQARGQGGAFAATA
jgi:Protein of unknown function (DUF2849)